MRTSAAAGASGVERLEQLPQDFRLHVSCARSAASCHKIILSVGLRKQGIDAVFQVAGREGIGRRAIGLGEAKLQSFSICDFCVAVRSRAPVVDFGIADAFRTRAVEWWRASRRCGTVQFVRNRGKLARAASRVLLLFDPSEFAEPDSEHEADTGPCQLRHPLIVRKLRSRKRRSARP